MRAKRRGRLVYTERGPGAKIKPAPSPTTPVLVTAPRQVIELAPPQLVPEEACPHGGLFLHDVPVCGICSDGEQIGLALLHIARKLSYKIPVASATPEDVMMVSVLAMVANQKKILSAREPGALAHTIGKRAVLKMYRPKSLVAIAVGKMKLYDDEDTKLEQTSQKLEFLDQQRVLAEQDEQWAAECYERARTFPGIDLVWTAKNFERLQEAIEDGKRDLPSTPIDQWRVIDMRLGLSEGMKEHGWQEIADVIAPSWKPIPEHQVRRAYHAGLAFLKTHLIKTLVPDKNVIPNDISKLGQIPKHESA